MKLMITFGQKYRREPHPSYPAAHPDLWVEVEGDSLQECYDLIGEHLGQFYAFSHSEDQWEKEDMAKWYPRGCHEVLRKKESA